jgi:short-subunit dehydrogenase
MYLGEVPQQELWDILNINIGATTMMTRLILPQMQKRKRGAIVNVSSGSELQPLPLMTVYAASKVHYQAEFNLYWHYIVIFQDINFLTANG